ncbi:MAG TPA: hypothetical protein VFW83_08945 [Bryobacteraceae bacterium]|nr:hypothetical protein [Bryobacteraceae bacterium]
MGRFAWILVFSAPVLLLSAPAEKEMPPGIFRGAFVSWKGTPAAGQFTIRTAADALLSCHYDSLSYVGRNHERAGVAKLEPGDPLEVLADRKIGSRQCYARIVQVINPQIAREPATAKRSPRIAALPFAPRWDRTFAGIVIRHDGKALTIRTRTGDETMALRPDTRYLSGGLRIGPAALSINTHVFVRAGKDIYGKLEAYQVMWGDILKVP